MTVSDAAGGSGSPPLRCCANPALAVAVEDAVDAVARRLHAYPRSGNVVVWYDPQRHNRAELLEAIGKGLDSDPEATAARIPARPMWTAADPTDTLRHQFESRRMASVR